MKIIDGHLLLAWLDATYGKETLPYLYTELKSHIESGTFDIKEDIPIFQLKDRVYHKDFKAKGTIIKIAKSGKRAYVRWDDGSPASYVLLDKLIKVESQI